MNVADIISGRKGQKHRNEHAEISQCLLGAVFSKLFPSSATIQTPIFIFLFCARDPRLTLSPITSSPTTMSLYSKLPFGKLEEKDFYDWRVF